MGQGGESFKLLGPCLEPGCTAVMGATSVAERDGRVGAGAQNLRRAGHEAGDKLQIKAQASGRKALRPARGRRSGGSL